MFAFVLTIHSLLALTLIGSVLLQQGKGADVGAAFGSGGASTVFGAAGSASFMQKMTTAIAVCFFITSLGLAWMAAHRQDSAPSSVIDATTATESKIPAETADLPPALTTDNPSATGDLPPVTDNPPTPATGDLPPVKADTP